MKHLDRIETRYNLWGHFGHLMVFIFFIVILTFLMNAAYGSENVTALFIYISIVIFIIYYFWVHSVFRRRKHTITAMAKKKQWSYADNSQGNISEVDFSRLSLSRLSKKQDYRYENCIVTPEWTYCDYAYGVYRKTKYGEYKAGDVYYAAMGTVLPRKMPNVLFDSLKSRKRQFRMTFSGSQLHSLEGDFDKHFATYFPDEYKIDGLSFITPDVMLALRDASDYDIEIIDNELFIFGSLDNPEVQIPQMAHYLAKIKKQLLDNILTYRDERLPYAVGRKTVAIQGQSLRPSKWPLILSLLSLVLALLYWFIIALLKKY